jgi:hypothetical protein
VSTTLEELEELEAAIRSPERMLIYGRVNVPSLPS